MGPSSMNNQYNNFEIDTTLTDRINAFYKWLDDYPKEELVLMEGLDPLTKREFKDLVRGVINDSDIMDEQVHWNLCMLFGQMILHNHRHQ